MPCKSLHQRALRGGEHLSRYQQLSLALPPYVWDFPQFPPNARLHAAARNPEDLSKCTDVKGVQSLCCSAASMALRGSDSSPIVYCRPQHGFRYLQAVQRGVSPTKEPHSPQLKSSEDRRGPLHREMSSPAIHGVEVHTQVSRRRHCVKPVVPGWPLERGVCYIDAHHLELGCRPLLRPSETIVPQCPQRCTGRWLR